MLHCSSETPLGSCYIRSLRFFDSNGRNWFAALSVFNNVTAAKLRQPEVSLKGRYLPASDGGEPDISRICRTMSSSDFTGSSDTAAFGASSMCTIGGNPNTHTVTAN